MDKYQILPYSDEFGTEFKIYSEDFSTFYGNFYSWLDVAYKLSALRVNEKLGVRNVGVEK